jgi:hypothetical protein
VSESENNQNPRLAARKLRSDLVSDGHKSNGNGCEECNETDKCVNYSYSYLNKLLFRELQAEDLQNGEERDDQNQRDRNILHGRKQNRKDRARIGMHASVAVGDLIRDLSACTETEEHHGKDRPNGAHRDQTEAVFTRIFAAHRRCDTDTERHDEGNGDGARRYAARVKGEGKKMEFVRIDRHKYKRQRKQHHVKVDEHACQVLFEDDL